MPTKPIVQITSVGSQRDRRYLDTFYDPHRSPRFVNGRPWWGTREIAANREADPHVKDGFCGGDLVPGRHVEEGEARETAWKDGWTAPWYPEARWFEFDYKHNRIHFLYDSLIGYDRAEEQKYYRAAALITVEKGWRETPYGSRPRFEVRAIQGEPPRSPQIATAAKAGDPWILGFTERQNTQLARLLGLTPMGLEMPRDEGTASPDEILTMTHTELRQLIAAEMDRIMGGSGGNAKKTTTTKKPDPDDVMAAELAAAQGRE